MTNPDYTAVAILADRSGSMSTIVADAQGGLNTFIASQRKLPGKCTARLSQFDGAYDTVYESTPVADAPDYVLEPRGMTALYDAIARLTNEFGAELAAMDEDERPGTVIVVVQTDGLENSSKEWTAAKLRKLIERQREKYSWDFVFLGANQDAVLKGREMGFAGSSSLTYTASSAGTQAAYGSLSGYVTSVRSTGSGTFSEDDRTAATSS